MNCPICGNEMKHGKLVEEQAGDCSGCRREKRQNLLLVII